MGDLQPPLGNGRKDTPQQARLGTVTLVALLDLEGKIRFAASTIWWPIGHDGQGIGRKAFEKGGSKRLEERATHLSGCTSQAVKRHMFHMDVGHRNKPLG